MCSLCSDLRRNVEAGGHSLTSFAKEVQHICEGAIVRLFPVDKAAASKVLGALDIANRMLMDWQVTHDAPRRPQYAPVNDRGLWLPPAEVQQFLQPAPPPWEPPPPPLPAWLQDVAPEQLQAAALQLAAHQQQQQQVEQQQQQLAQQQYIQQQEQQYAVQFADQPLPLPPPPQTMSMQEFLQLPHQEQHYQLLLQRRQQAAAAADWDAILAAQSPADDQTRRVVRHTVRRPPSAPSSGKRKDSSDGSGASKLVNGSARGVGVAKPPKKPKVKESSLCPIRGPAPHPHMYLHVQHSFLSYLQVDSEEQPALSQAQRNFLADLLDGLAADPTEVSVLVFQGAACPGEIAAWEV